MKKLIATLLMLAIPALVALTQIGCGAEGALCREDNDCGQKLKCIQNTCKESACLIPCREGYTCAENGRCVQTASGENTADAATDASPADAQAADKKISGPTCKGAKADYAVGDSSSCYIGTNGCKADNDGVYKCVGICKLGTRKCLARNGTATWGNCVGQISPRSENTPEACNDGLDNDCDGDVDDKDSNCDGTGKTEPTPDAGPGPDKTPECTNDERESCTLPNLRGECAKGFRICVAGMWSRCIQQTMPSNEVCDGKDNDCDGQIDEGDLTRECYPSGATGCSDRGDGKFNCSGICKAGTQKCVVGGSGVWTSCQDFVLSKSETCNGQDDDCDGQTDEGNVCTCKDGETRPCFSGSTGCQKRQDGKYDCNGICKHGIQTCSNNQWGACLGEVKAEAEVCNNKDDNCDGKTDENITQLCYGGTSGCTKRSDGTYSCKGACKNGVRTCTNGRWGSCQGEINPLPSDIACNGTDENCDGQVDENCACTKGETRSCTTNSSSCPIVQIGTISLPICKGACKAGTQTCRETSPGNNQWGPCENETKAKQETCNGQDDDCDGNVDGLQRDCYPGPSNECQKLADGTIKCNGVCSKGIQFCSNNRWGSCFGSKGPTSTTDTCGNNLDDNCDGQVDETCPCKTGETRRCYPSNTGCKLVNPPDRFSCTGSCGVGTQICGSNRQWSSCQAATTPVVEVCNNLDDDCDGQTDENLVRSCLSAGNNGCTKQQDGSYSCKGTCSAGTQSCSQGKWSNCSDTAPKVEICGNAKDDDCDGQTDETCTCTPGTKRECYPSALAGCTEVQGTDTYRCALPCKTGTQTCSSNGQWGTCSGAIVPTQETCNGKDDDCDGNVDNNAGCNTEQPTEPKPEPSTEPSTEPVQDTVTDGGTSEPTPGENQGADAGPDAGTTDSTPETSADAQPDTPPRTCQVNSDCALNHVCFNSVCTKAQCSTTMDCQNVQPGTVCRNQICVGCVSTSDCSGLPYTTCNITTNRCDPECKVNADCNGKGIKNTCLDDKYQLCKAGSKSCRCEAPTCSTAADCRGICAYDQGQGRMHCEKCTTNGVCTIPGRNRCVAGECIP